LGENSNRTSSVLTKKENLEKIFHLSKFPVYAGCVDTPENEDIFLDMNVSICKDTGIIQFDQIPPLELIYLRPHNDSIGKTWKDHHTKFAEFISKFPVKKILEVGGGTTKIAKKVIEKDSKKNWTIIDPNMIENDVKQIDFVKDYFHKDLEIDRDFDAIVHSHTIEHMKDPEQYVRDISKFIKNDGYHIFSFPNMVTYLSRKYLNCLNFEHPQFLAEPFVDVILERQGFEIIEKKFFKEDHSIFYATKKSQNYKKIEFPNKFNEYKKIYSEFINYYKNFTDVMNKKLKEYDGEVYLFGAHLFSQYLIAFGLNQEKIVGILDNSELKIGKRLYGTKLNVFHPEKIKNKEKIAIILKVATYREEILEQLYKINPSIEIFE
jgi:2-polyprenyl-3-methyl-5-hydroxy-6-metoxy-1,4-benzoquinol methylase